MEMGAFTGALVALLAKDMASAIASEMGKDVSGAAKQALRATSGPTSVRQTSGWGQLQLNLAPECGSLGGVSLNLAPQGHSLGAVSLKLARDGRSLGVSH
jgi:hypothetical protein